MFERINLTGVLLVATIFVGLIALGYAWDISGHFHECISVEWNS